MFREAATVMLAFAAALAAGTAIAWVSGLALYSLALVTIPQAALTVVLSEARRVRGLLFWIAAGLVIAWSALLIVPDARLRAFAALTAMGLAGGSIYWRLAGRRAGRLAAALARLGAAGDSPPANQSGRVAPGGLHRYQNGMADLKLIALDDDDLKVVSAHVQDAVLRVGDVAFVPRDRRFVALVNRFDWTGPSTNASGKPVRRRAAMRFERVLSVKSQGVDLQDKRSTLALLAITFAPKAAEGPDGDVTLTFSGGAAIRLAVECLEVQLQDLGAAWTAKRAPAHPEDNG
jgi:hypothetical protein